MLNLDLKEAETSAALVLAAIVAGQVAEDLGKRACIHGLTDELKVEIPDSADHLREVYVAHLERQLGDGFVVSSEGDGFFAVRLYEGGEEEAVVEEVIQEVPAAEAPKKRRGRPPRAKVE